MCKEEIEFAVFCVESIAEALKMNAKDVYNVLAVQSKILDEYIIPSYEPLHTQGKEYIVNEIIEIMKEAGVM